MGGPYDDGSGGVVVFKADDIVDVNGIVANDPAVRERILHATVRKWLRVV